MAARLRVALIVASLFAAAGCSSSTAPSMASVAGSWSGSTNPPSRANVFSIGFTIEQTDSSLSGTWGTTSNGGTFTGDVKGAVVSMIATSRYTDRQCPQFSVTATVSGNRMIGTTAPINCAGAPGAIDLTRQ